VLLEKPDESGGWGEQEDGKETNQKKAPCEPERQRLCSWHLRSNQIAKAQEQDKPHYTDDNGEDGTEALIVGKSAGGIRGHVATSFLSLIPALI
jgi:hypothetical protein